MNPFGTFLATDEDFDLNFRRRVKCYREKRHGYLIRGFLIPYSLRLAKGALRGVFALYGLYFKYVNLAEWAAEDFINHVQD